MSHASRAIKMVSVSKNNKETITAAVGDLSGIDLTGDLVLLGTYIRPEKTSGGILLPDSVLAEDEYQGKVGLVLKWGPDAFRNIEDGSIYEQHVKPGEWGVYKVGDAWSININGYPCRVVRDVGLKMKVKDPGQIY